MMVTLTGNDIPKNFPRKFNSFRELASKVDDYYTEYYEVNLPAEDFLSELQKNIKNDRTVA